MEKQASIQFLLDNWKNSPRWAGIERPYTAEDVVKLRGSVHVEYSLAKMGAKKIMVKIALSGFCMWTRGSYRKSGRTGSDSRP
jgi:isocitrate lyase